MTHGESYVAAYVERWMQLSGTKLTETPNCVVSVGKMIDNMQLEGMTYWQAQLHGREAAEQDFAR